MRPDQYDDEEPIQVVDSYHQVVFQYQETPDAKPHVIGGIFLLILYVVANSDLALLLPYIILMNNYQSNSLIVLLQRENARLKR